MARVARLAQPGGLDQLTVTDEQVEPRAPEQGEIAVRIHASSVNYHDYLVVSGQLRVTDGRVPMSDGAGEVIAVGAGVSEFKAGDRVIGTFFPNWQDGRSPAQGFAFVPGEGIDGFAQEYVTAPTTSFTHAPQGYSHAEAATLPCAGLTAWRALFVEGEVKPGDSVLVQGTGGVSIFALQLAKAIGATVVATSSSAEKRDRLLAMGADHVIDYKSNEKWGGAVKAALGRGVDHVVEVGGAGTLAQSISACREGGHIAVIGILSGGVAPVPAMGIMAKQLRLTGITVGSRRQQLDMVAGLNALDLKPVIDREFDLADIADAFRHQESGRHFGKIVLRV